jgi:uncharacterized protein
MAEPWHGRFAWSELTTTAPEAAERFYSRVVGWATQPFGGTGTPYTTWTAGDRAVGGLVPLTEEARAGGVPPGWLTYVAVGEADAAVARARELGATVTVPAGDVTGIGRVAVLADPQGAAFAILQPADPATYGPEEPPAPLEISWRELATSDREAAVAFYAALFGWEKQGASDMGEPVGVYQEFGRRGITLGGMYTKPADAPFPPFWLLYAKVHDIEASIAATREGGGKVLVGPMEIPGGDLICQVLDPQGAAFALHQAKG